ncbi:MAG: CBS domain-containing protein [Candidatus Hodarchaeaceae archaeon]|nr:CBS domain-containing protein [Candidatus Hodarchaeaceae archaeon]
MRVNQIMSSPAIALDKDLPLSNAIDLMKRNEISRLVALEGGRIVGVLTEKDIAREMGSMHAYRLPPGRMHVSNVMTPNPITIAPDVTAKRAAEIMLDHDISGLPVVEGSNLVGIVTKLDFAKVCVNYEDVYVGQVMQASPTTVTPGDRVIHARRLLLDEDLLVLPVMEGGKLVGVVTVRDVAMKLVAFQEVVPDRYKSERIRNLLVGDIMSQPATTIRTDAPLPRAAKLMLERRFSGLPVVNLEGELVGLLTKTELTEVARERL